MKNLKFLAVVVLMVLGIFVLNGCDPQTSAITTEAPQVIQAFGEAEVKGAPDLARISLVIETRDTLAEQAVEENASLAGAVVEALKEFGLSEEEIKTGSYRLYSYNEWIQDFPEHPEGNMVLTYQVTNELIVTTARLDAVGELIDLAVRAGVNIINYVNFEMEDPYELQMQALKLATEQAAKKAEAIAAITGEEISGLYRIREERADYRPYVYGYEMAADMYMGGGPTPIMPDEVTIRAMVSAEFSF